MKNGKTLKWLLTLACLLAALFAFTLAANAEIVDSGYCGDNLIWTLDSSGMLTISGTGTMNNYSYRGPDTHYFTTAPWCGSLANVRRVKTVVIESGVTSIGACAFYGCTGFTSVIIPDSITSIGRLAFFECMSLKSVTIPDSVTSIGEALFDGCKSLTSVAIPDSVTSIGSYAFYDTAWYNNQPDGLVYAGKVAYKYKGTMPAKTAIALKKDTKGIADDAFYNCTGLTAVIIPDSVTSIGDYAFYGCTALTSVTIPDSVTSIGFRTFYGCTGLTSATIGNGVTSIGSEAFPSGTVIYGVNNSAAQKYAKKYGNTFKYICEKGSGHKWNDGTITTAATCTGNGVKTYTCTVCKVTQKETIKATGHSYGAWTKLNDAQHQRVCANDKNHVEKASHAWDGGTITTAATCTGNGVKTYTCAVCKGTKTETLKATGHSYSAWTKLNDAQHRRVCANDKTHVEKADHVWDGGKVTTTGASGVLCERTYTCTVCGAVKKEAAPTSGTCGDKLTWTLSDAGALTVRGTGAIPDYSYSTDSSGGQKAYYTSAPWGGSVPEVARIKKVVIESGVTGIGTAAFAGCVSLDNVTIPASVTSIGKNAFLGCDNLNNVFYTGTQAQWKQIKNSAGITPTQYECLIENGIVYHKDKSAIYGVTDMDVASIVVPDSVTVIGARAFIGCKNLTAVSLPQSVTSIGPWAFAGCASLTDPALPSGITKIEYGTFRFCHGLKNVVLPDGVTAVGSSAFLGCSGLETVMIPESVTDIDKTAFPSCQPTLRGYKNSFAQSWADKNGYAFDVIACAGPHDWDAGTVTKQATCGAAGERQYRCNYCHEIRTESIPATNTHSWDGGKITTPAACTKDGVKTFTCTVCNATKTEAVKATGHSYGAWTNLNDAQHQRVCANDKTHVEKENHVWDEGKITTPAACTKDGVKTFTCTVCNATKTEAVKATGHSYGAWEKLDDTQHRRICSNDATHTETAAHTWDAGSVTKAPSCTVAGETTYVCTDCSATVTVPGDAALGHNWSAWTALDGTSHKRVCANDPTHVETAEHVWDDGTVTVEPTDKAEGVKTFTCTVCGATKTEAIPKTAPAIPALAPGDPDGDGKLTSADARLALRASVGLAEKGDVEKDSAGYLACDVDGDGKVTSADARLILRASVGLEDASKFGKKA